MKIYQIGYAGYLAGVQDVPDSQRVIPSGWTRTAPPEIPEGQYAVWTGRGWVLTDTPPPEPAPIYTPDPTGFLDALIDCLGAQKANSLLRDYPLFYPAVMHHHTGATALAIIDDIRAADGITQEQYDTIQDLWDQHHMPRPDFR